MAMVSITCPQCGHMKDVPKERIPEGPVKLTCPKCRHQFVYLYESGTAAQKSPPPPPTESDCTNKRKLPIIKELFKSTWCLYKKRAATLLCLILLVIFPYFAMTGIISSLRLLFPDSRLPLTMLGVIALLAMVVFSLWGAVSAVCAVLDETLTISGALKRGWQNFGSFIWLSLLHVIVVTGSFFLLFVPGIYLSVCFLFAQLIMINEGEKGLNALLKSKEYVRGYFFPVFGRFVLIWCIPLILRFLPMIGGILSLLCLPFALIYTRLLYQGLQSIKREMTFAVSRQYRWVWASLLGYFVFPIVFLSLPGLLLAPLSPFKSYLQNKPTGEPAPAAAGFMKMHNVFSELVGMVWDVNPVSMTAEQYDALLAAQKVNFESGIKVSVGPSAFLYGGFSKFAPRPGSIVLIIRLAQIPNIDLDSSKCARIVIQRVLDRDGGDRYEATKNGDFEQRLKMLIKRTTPTPSYEAMTSINLLDGTTEDNIATIEGTLELNLPVSIVTITLDSSNVGKPVTTAGTTMTLKKLTGAMVDLDFHGDAEKFLKMVGYSAKGEQIADMGMRTPGKSQSDNKGISASFVEDVHSIKVVVASDFILRKYPFVLKEPKGGFSRFAGNL